MRARRMIGRMARRSVRRMARRIVRRTFFVGGMVILASAGTAAAIKLTQGDAKRIQEHTGLPPEQLEDHDLQEAMQELNISPQPLTEDDKKKMA